MTDETVVPSKGARKKPFILFRIIQWVVAAFFGTLAIAPLADISKLSIPGAPIALFWSALAAPILAAIVLSPPLFFRLPIKVKVGAYLGGLAAFALFGTYAEQMQTAYERTPAGAAEAKARAEAEAVVAKAEAVAKEAAAKVAKADANKQQLEDLRAEVVEKMNKLEKCFSFFNHRLPALEEQLQESLHNPHSFEHVKTEAMLPDADGFDVAMVFRAENAMSALRTARIRAAVDPESCKVVRLGEIESE